MPRAHVDVVIATQLLYILQIHNVIPERQKESRKDKARKKKKKKSEASLARIQTLYFMFRRCLVLRDLHRECETTTYIINTHSLKCDKPPRHMLIGSTGHTVHLHM